MWRTFARSRYNFLMVFLLHRSAIDWCRVHRRGSYLYPSVVMVVYGWINCVLFSRSFYVLPETASFQFPNSSLTLSLSCSVSIYAGHIHAHTHTHTGNWAAQRARLRSEKKVTSRLWMHCGYTLEHIILLYRMVWTWMWIVEWYGAP